MLPVQYDLTMFSATSWDSSLCDRISRCQKFRSIFDGRLLSRMDAECSIE